MRGKFSVAMAVMTIGLVAAPVQAAEVLNETCSGNCFTGLDIVNLENASDAAVGVGTVNGATVRFTSTTDLLDLANGAATVSASDGSGFGNLIFELLDGFSFTQADFSLLQATKPISLIFWTNDGEAELHIANPTGSEPFGIQATNAPITKVRIDTTEGSFATFKQLKLGGVSQAGAVPEPATWALMLLGFGAVGFAMRRRGEGSAPRIRVGSS